MNTNSRVVIYTAMVFLLSAILFGATLNAPPIYLAVGFIGEIILVATAHLSTMIERFGVAQGGGQDRQTSVP